MKEYLKAVVSPQVPENVGEVHVSWTFPEFVREKRSKVWYVIVSVILGLMLTYAVLTGNYLFAVILFLAVFTVVFQYFQEARDIPVVIAEDGIIVDKQFYPYRDLKNFWLAYEPPEVKLLYLEFKSSIKGGLPIPLEDINPLEVRNALLDYLDEDLEKDEEELNETLARVFKVR